MWQGLRVAVVIPAYREERLLPVTLQALPVWIDDVVVVDDASDDATSEVAHAQHDTLASADTTLYVERLEVNRGVGHAIVRGYLLASERGADVAVVVGADAQMCPEEMPRLLEAISRGADYAKGERFSHPEVRARMPKARYWGNRALSLATALIAGLPELRDAQCGYTALRLSALKDLPLSELYPRYGFPNDLLFRLVEVGARVEQVPVSPIYGSEQSKLSIPRVTLPLLWILTRGLTRRLFTRRVQRALS
jgi:glycosyltransferase involved in cell wall biosynthesis